MTGIGDLMSNPGGLSPTIAQAIAPFLAQQSQQIGQQYRGIGSEQAGSLARSNAPMSIRTALQSALDVAQQRAQSQVTQGAYAQSEQLRRQDLDQTYRLLDAMLQFTSSGRGQAIQGLAAAQGPQQTQQAANAALIGNLIASWAANRQGAARPQDYTM